MTADVTDRPVRPRPRARDLTGLAEPHHALAAARLPVPVLLYLLAVIIPIGIQAGPLALTALRLLLMVMAATLVPTMTPTVRPWQIS